jgi:hypothetical protein
VPGLPSPTLGKVLIEDFRLHNTNLQNQYTRMHGRMQLITGLNTALLPALGALAVAAGRDEVGHGWLLLFPAAGLLLSIIGYVAGANDRYLVELYRKQVAAAAKHLLESTKALPELNIVYETWAHAGRDPRDVKNFFKNGSAGDGPGGEWNSLTSWRWDSVSVTRLPAVLSLIFILVWVVVLVLLAIALQQNTLVGP